MRDVLRSTQIIAQWLPLVCFPSLIRSQSAYRVFVCRRRRLWMDWIVDCWLWVLAEFSHTTTTTKQRLGFWVSGCCGRRDQGEGEWNGKGKWKWKWKRTVRQREPWEPGRPGWGTNTRRSRRESRTLSSGYRRFLRFVLYARGSPKKKSKKTTQARRRGERGGRGLAGPPR